MGFPTTLPRKDRTQIRDIGLGVLSQSFDIGAGASGVSAVGGTGASSTLVLSPLGLRAGDVVTGAVCFEVGAPTGATLAKMSLYSAVGTAATFLKATADFSATLAANSWQQYAFAGGAYTVPADGLYWLGLLTLAATTQPTFLRGTSQTGYGAVLAGGAFHAAGVAAQSDVTGNVTMVVQSTLYWLGAYGTAV